MLLPHQRGNAMMMKLLRSVLSGGSHANQMSRLVTYTPDQFRRHIERQFVRGMGWHNMREWHIDHIIPISSFAITSLDCPDFKAAWCMSNLRPLWARDNLAKSGKRTHLI